MSDPSLDPSYTFMGALSAAQAEYKSYATSTPWAKFVGSDKHQIINEHFFNMVERIVEEARSWENGDELYEEAIVLGRSHGSYCRKDFKAHVLADLTNISGMTEDEVLNEIGRPVTKHKIYSFIDKYE